MVIQPLYQVATAALNPSDIAVPIRSIPKDDEATSLVLAEAEEIETGTKTVRLGDGQA